MIEKITTYKGTVDGKEIKPDTWYALKNGIVVEAEDSE